MTTVLEIVTDALEDLVEQAAESPIEAPDAAGAIRYLNDLMADLEANGIDLDYTVVSNLGETVTVVAGAMRGIKALLALDLCSKYDVPVSDALSRRAGSGYKTLVNLAVSVSESNFPDTLPVGSGNYSTTSETFFPEQDTEEAEDAEDEDDTDTDADPAYVDQYINTGAIFALTSAYLEYIIYCNSASAQTVNITGLSLTTDGFRATIVKTSTGDTAISLPATPAGITWGDGTDEDITITTIGEKFSLVYNYELNKVFFDYAGAYDQG